jgi:3D (Asp-Asp-Asp) domain-containing protein
MKKIILGLTCAFVLTSCSIETNDKVEAEIVPIEQEDNGENQTEALSEPEVLPLSEDIPPERIEVKKAEELRKVAVEVQPEKEVEKPKVIKIKKKKPVVKTKPVTQTKVKATNTPKLEKVRVQKPKPTKTDLVRARVAEVKIRKVPKKVERIEVKATKPVQTKPVQTKPVQTKPVQTKPVQTKPVQTKTTKPIATKPIATKPIATKSEADSSKKTINFELTFFTTLPQHNGGWTVTSTGKKLVGLKNTVASNYYPLGTKIFLEGIGEVTVRDRGGPNFNSPKRLDVLVQRKSGESNSAYTKRVWAMGRQKVKGYLTK